MRERSAVAAAPQAAEAAAHVAPAATAEPVGATLEPPREPTPTPTPTPGTAPPLRATDLLRAGGTLVPTLAAQSYGSERSPEAIRQRVQAIAAAPTLGALADSNNRLPAGTVGHDRTVARRAQEFLDPQREVTGIGALLAEAPTRSLGQIQRNAPLGESAAGAAMDAVHAQSYTSAQMPPGYAPCQDYRALTLTAELTHGADGAVTASRVLRSSGSRRLDTAALAALQDAHGEVDPARGGVPPTTRWIVEVGEDRDAHVPVACGSTGGWTVWAPRGARFGVRVRVRRDRTTPGALR